MLQTPEEGAQTSLFCAAAAELDNVSEKYFSDCAVSRMSNYAKNDFIAKRLWEKSEKLVNL